MVKDTDGALDKAWALVLQFGGGTENLLAATIRSHETRRAHSHFQSGVPRGQRHRCRCGSLAHPSQKPAHRAKIPRSPDLDIHLDISHNKPAPKLTLVLHDVPLDEVLRYTASFSGLAPPEGDDAVTLEGMGGALNACQNTSRQNPLSSERSRSTTFSALGQSAGGIPVDGCPRRRGRRG